MIEAARETVPAAAIEPVLVRAAERGDRIAYTIRSVVAVMLLVRIVAMHGRELLAGSPVWLIMSLVLVGALVERPLLRMATRGPPGIAVQVSASVTVDALVVTFGILPLLVWPIPGYMGLLRSIDTGFYCLTISGAGLRLLKPALVTGIVANLAGLVLLLSVDRAFNGPRLAYGATEVVLACIQQAGAAVLAYFLASRTQRLVFEGAQATLLAERARQRLGIYVSEEIAAKTLAESAPELGGTRRPVAVLFSDLRGFTRYAEGLAPEQLVSELNAYLDAMVREIRREGGIVDKYIGDAIMAVFGLVGDGADAPARALRAAAGMQHALAGHNAGRAASGRPPLRQGIGVHFGSVIAGNIGTPERMQYTVVGDIVNIASRLESATKDLGVPVIASSQIVEAALGSPDLPPIEPRGELELRGASRPLQVYAVGGA